MTAKALWSRRTVLGTALAGLGAATIIRPSAAADNGLLAKLRGDGVIKIGVANNMPWSTLNPDGTLDGIAPSIVKVVVGRLGIPKVEAAVASYGELVTGMLAGRWDMIGASLTISPERCKQVIYADPFYRKDESQWVCYLKSEVANPPKSYTDVGARFASFGALRGGAENSYLQAAADKGMKGTMVQFPDPDLALEGVLTKRIPIFIIDEKSAHLLHAKRPTAFEIAPVDPEHPNRGSGGAFRKGDPDLHAAFVTEFRAIKKSGECAEILKKFGFEYDAKFMEISGEEACSL